MNFTNNYSMCVKGKYQIFKSNKMFKEFIDNFNRLIHIYRDDNIVSKFHMHTNYHLILSRSPVQSRERGTLNNPEDMNIDQFHHLVLVVDVHLVDDLGLKFGKQVLDWLPVHGATDEGMLK